MNPRQRPALLVAGVVWLAGAAYVPAQTRPSHVPIPGGVTPEVADQFLRNRLDSAQTAGELEKLARDILENPAKYNLSPAERQRLLRAAGDPDHPDARKAVQRLLERESGAGIDPEQAKRWQEALRRFGEQKEAPQPGRTEPTPETGPSEAKPPESMPRNRPDAPPAVEPASPAPNKPPSRPQERLSQELRSLGERLATTPLGQSAAMRRMVLSLERVPPGDKVGEGAWDRRLAALGERLPSNIRWPRFGGGRRRDGGLGIRPPPTSLPPPIAEGGSDDTLTIGLVLIAFGLAGAAVLALSRRRGGLRLSRRPEGERLGPWPVRPEAVRTREELVRAFEYLSLLLLGPAARAWNHRDIAAGLGDSPARSGAAERLAGLYERARYAPPDEPLPEPELGAARRDLRYLAGASAV